MKEVFLSYRQTSNAERTRVRTFAESLRNSGISVVLDQFLLDDKPEGPSEGWDKWSSDRALNTDYVIIIGSKSWFECFEKTQPPGTGLGAACEADDLRARIYDAAGFVDNIRVVVFDDDDAQYISAKIKRYHRFHATRDFTSIVKWLGGSVLNSSVEKSGELKISNQRSHSPLRSITEDNNEPRGIANALSRGHYGLDDALQECSRRLGKRRLLAVFGMAGVGKSVLVDELRRLPEWRDHRLVQITAREDSGIADFFSQIATHIGIHDERPRPPSGQTAAEIADALRRLSSEVPPFFIHVQRAHLWLPNGHWKDVGFSRLLEGLLQANPSGVIVLETREQPEAELISYEAGGLTKQALAEYLAHPPGLTTGWTLSSDQRTYLFSRLGGGHGRGAHAFGLALLVRLAAEKLTSPYDVLKQYPDDYAQALYDKLFRDLYEKVLTEAERGLLFACALYRDGLHYSHLPRLEKFIPAENAGAVLIRRRLLTESTDWLHLHDLAAEQAIKLVSDENRTLSLHQVIADLWLDELRGHTALMEANIRRALEALYHLEQGGQSERVAEIAAQLLGRRAEEAISVLWRMEKRCLKDGQWQKVRMLLEYILKVDPENHRAMRYLGESLKNDETTKSRALDLFDRACDFRPDFPQYWANLGNLSAEAGEIASKRFLDRLDATIVRFPATENEVVTFNRARCLDALGRRDEASDVRMQEIRKGTRHPQTFNGEIAYRRKHRKWDVALELLAQAKSRGCYDGENEVLHAEILRDMGNEPEAQRIRKKLILEKSRESRVYAQEADYQLSLGDCKEAISVLTQGRALCKKDDYLTAILARAYDDDPTNEHGSRIRTKEIQDGSQNAVFFADEITWLRKHKRTQQAIALYERAVQLGIFSNQLLATHLKTLQIVGRGSEASRIRMEKIEQGATEAVFFNEEALWLIEQGDRKAAKQLLALAKERGAIDSYTEHVFSILRQFPDWDR